MPQLLQIGVDFDWLGLVWVPILITIFVGGPLSIYLAFVVNRLAAFRQIRLMAVNEIAGLRKATLETDNYGQAFVTLMWFLESPVIAMAAEDQWEVTSALKTLRHNLRSYFQNAFDSEVRNLGYRERFQLKGQVWAEAQTKVYGEARDVLRRAVKQLQELRPDPWRILGLKPTNSTLNRWDHHRLGRLAMAGECSSPSRHGGIRCSWVTSRRYGMSRTRFIRRSFSRSRMVSDRIW